MYRPLKEPTLVNKYIQVFFVVSLYWLISIITVFVNKTLLSSSYVKLDAPLFVTWFQCVVSTVVCFLMSCLSKLWPGFIIFPSGNPLDKDTFRKVLPLSLLFTGMIATNNICLKYVGVAFYYVGRSLTTVFNVVFTYTLLGEKTSWKCTICCIVIVFGFWLGVNQETLTDSFSLQGTIFGVLGSIALSLYSIYTKKTLPSVNHEVWLLSYYNNFYSALLFLPLIFLNGEVSEVMQYENIGKPWFWFAMMAGGFCGFSIGFVTALQIKVTSPLSHNISGTAKACAQTVIATQWYDEPKSFLWWTSNAVVLFASAAYARVKQVEMGRQHRSTIEMQKI